MYTYVYTYIYIYVFAIRLTSMLTESRQNGVSRNTGRFTRDILLFSPLPQHNVSPILSYHARRRATKLPGKYRCYD